MTAALIVIVLAFAAVIAIDYATPAIKEWLRRREIIRRNAFDQEMQAMRAARQLSLMAWRARHEMYDIANQGRASTSGHPAKHQ